MARPDRVRSSDPGPQLIELACIAELRKNSRETLHITLDQSHGLALVGLRVWQRDSYGEPRPTRSGFACRVVLLPKLAHAVGRAYAEAQNRQLL